MNDILLPSHLERLATLVHELKVAHSNTLGTRAFVLPLLEIALALLSCTHQPRVSPIKSHHPPPMTGEPFLAFDVQAQCWFVAYWDRHSASTRCLHTNEQHDFIYWSPLPGRCS